MNPYVKDVRPLDNYQLELTFENDEQRLFDVSPYLQRGIFVRLQDRITFQAARVVADPGTTRSTITPGWRC